jgi:hypothetical protein
MGARQMQGVHFLHTNLGKSSGISDQHFICLYVLFCIAAPLANLATPLREGIFAIAIMLWPLSLIA